MQIRFRRNPKTTGWARRIAIALLAGFAAFWLTMPLSFFLLLAHYSHATPNDPQNMLEALTVAMLVSVALALLTVAASLVFSFFFGLGRVHEPPSSPVVS